MQRNTFSQFKPFYWLAVIFVIAMGLFILYRSKKEKYEFYQVTGPVTMLSKTHPDFPQRAKPLDRYIQVAGFGKAFEIYLGGGSGDILPEFQAYSELKMGDIITVYYEDEPFFINSGDQGNKIIFSTQQIDKAGKPIYIRGNIDKYFANFFIIMGVLLALFLYTYRN